MIRISFESTGKILEADPPLKEGLNVLGKLHGLVTPSFELEPVSEAELPDDASPFRIDAAGPAVFVRNGTLEWAAPDSTASRDLFYGEITGGQWLLTDDFFRICREFSKLRALKSACAYFARRGYLPPGETFFKEIARVRVGTKLVFSGLVPREEDVWGEGERDPRTYETFKRAFSSVFETYPFGDQAGVSLSAGPDSGLVAAVATLQQGKRPLALTIVTPNQPLAINDIDEANAGRVARHLGLEHAAVEFDYNKHHAAELKDVVQAMPLGAHLSLHFFQMGKEARKRGRDQLWSGQSADSVYNLGPTQKSLGGPLRRFYLTREYWQGFPDVAGNRMIGGVARAMGALGPVAWRLVHKQDLRQPRSFQELIEAFALADGTPPFLPKMSESPNEYARARGGLERLTTRQAREKLFAWKAQAFLTGRDARVFYATAGRYGMESVLPYTSANMLQFFRSLEMTLQDVWDPKRFIYRYLEELLGTKAFKELYIRQAERVQDISRFTWTQWQEHVLSNTQLGQELREVALKSELRNQLGVERDWNPSDFQHVLSLAWLQYVFSEVEELGVNVIVNG